MSNLNNGVTLLWFRQDLRLADHPALTDALAYAEANQQPVIPVYILDEKAEGDWGMGGASHWWLHHSLASLKGQLNALDARLILRQGDTLEAIRELLGDLNLPLQAATVFYTARLEPAALKQQEAVTVQLEQSGARVFKQSAGSLLFDIENVRTQQGKPFQVYSPFWKACYTAQAGKILKPLPAPGTWPLPECWPESLELEALNLLPRSPDWAGGFRESWQPGEAGSDALLKRFISEGLNGYAEDRNRPDHRGTSQLSPGLHFGEISPRQVWHAVLDAEVGNIKALKHDAERYLKEIGWRDFGYHLLTHFPDTPDQPLRPQFKIFPWEPNEKLLQAWQRGQTGYPIVDAGMRQLWHTGWMHNRVRMVVASFLVKHLLQPWQAGSQWFWDTLVDADLASNTLGWQWAAGCGADAAPYFRIFNPMLQGAKFDPDGAYIRRWVPELAGLDTAYIHTPWATPPLTRQACRFTPGETYPLPIVDHQQARAKALDALSKIRIQGG